MLRYSRPASVLYPSILNLKSKDEDIINKEIKKAQETLIKLDNEDKEKYNPSFFSEFFSEFADGFTSVFKEIYNGGEKVVNGIDNLTDSVFNLSDKLNWLFNHPLY